MAWIESHQTLRNHPKLTMLSEKLGITKAQAIGHLQMLWWWCIDYADDGQIDTYSPIQIASACDWQGNAGELIQALADSGFIDRDPLRVHDWLDFCGDLIKKRLEYRKAKHRRTKRLGKSLRKGENSQLTVTVPDRNRTIPTKPDKERHLEFVWLTPEEHGKLRHALGPKLTLYLGRLNGYIGQIGERKAAQKYTSHYHTILNWMRKDQETGGIDGTNERKSFPDFTAIASEARRNKAAEGLRKVAEASGGSILARIRDSAVDQTKHEQPDSESKRTGLGPDG